MRRKYSGHPMFLELTKKEIELHNIKNRDYAKGGDPLGNFKRVAQILSLYPGLDNSNPAVVDLIYMMKQLDAVLWNLSQKSSEMAEDIDHRLTDIHVYAKLARILLCQ